MIGLAQPSSGTAPSIVYLGGDMTAPVHGGLSSSRFGGMLEISARFFGYLSRNDITPWVHRTAFDDHRGPLMSDWSAMFPKDRVEVWANLSAAPARSMIATAECGASPVISSAGVLTSR